MLDHTAETRAQYLERRIAEVRDQRDLLQNKPWGVSISAEDDRLYAIEQRLTTELHEIRPYAIVENGSTFIVSHKGMFVLDEAGENWLTFETADQAQAWMSEVMTEGREVAA